MDSSQKSQIFGNNQLQFLLKQYQTISQLLIFHFAEGLEFKFEDLCTKNSTNVLHIKCTETNLEANMIFIYSMEMFKHGSTPHIVAWQKIVYLFL